MRRPEPLRLSTPRLLLRPLEEADLPFLLSLFTDPRTLRAWPRPMTEAEVRALLDRHLALAREADLGLRAVVLRKTGEPIGTCGLAPAKLEGAAETEIAWHLHHARWGQGHATEAAGAVLDDAWTRRGLARVVALVLPENHASATVARRVGMAPEREVAWHGLRHVLWATRAP